MGVSPLEATASLGRLFGYKSANKCTVSLSWEREPVVDIYPDWCVYIVNAFINIDKLILCIRIRYRVTNEQLGTSKRL